MEREKWDECKMNGKQKKTTGRASMPFLRLCRQGFLTVLIIIIIIIGNKTKKLADYDQCLGWKSK